jgi:AmmeMemoRadiSam system protein B
MSVPEKPRLRPGLAAAPEDESERSFVVWDQLRLSDGYLRLTAVELEWVQLLDGRRTLRDVQSAAVELAEGLLIPLEVIDRLVRKLDGMLFLDTPRYREELDRPVRKPSCLGAYETDPQALNEQLEGLFAGPGGPGLPGEPQPDGRLRAVLAPHIDYARGGKTYAWAFKELFEHSPASLFVIIGTSHYSSARFTLTRKHFETPLGIAPTDGAYIDRLVEHYGDGLFDDEHQAHLPEHSIELEVVFLQYLYQNRRPIRIVPLVVGSFHDCVYGERLPAEAGDIGRMIQALRDLDETLEEPVGYLISGDLAHIGPKFGDPRPVGAPLLEHSRRQDHALLEQAESADPAGYFRLIAAERDERRICGLPPTYTLLEALRPGRGKVLHYDQYVEPRGRESVSFASMAFYR